MALVLFVIAIVDLLVACPLLLVSLAHVATDGHGGNAALISLAFVVTGFILLWELPQ